MNKANDHEPLRYVKVFIFILLIAAIISISYKLYTLSKNSSFRGATFNTVVIGKSVWILHIDTSKKQISTVELLGARAKLINKSPIELSSALGVFIDGSVVMKPDSQYYSPSDFFIKPFYKFSNINDLDTVKMIYYYQTASTDKKLLRRIKANANGYLLGPASSLQAQYGDEQLLNEQKSIEVINAVGIDGLGTTVGTSLKSIGLNVVEIGSADNKKSTVYSSNPDSISVKRIAAGLQLPIKQQLSGSVADITLVIGKDLLGGSR